MSDRLFESVLPTSKDQNIKATHKRPYLFGENQTAYYAVVDGVVMYKGPNQQIWRESTHTISSFKEGVECGFIEEIKEIKE